MHIKELSVADANTIYIQHIYSTTRYDQKVLTSSDVCVFVFNVLPSSLYSYGVGVMWLKLSCDS